MAYIDVDNFAKAICDFPAIDENTANAMIFLLRKQPTADVEEVKHGEWIQGVPYRCSICGNPAPEEKNTSERYSCWLSPYCPNCGADMRGKTNG